MPSRLSLTAEQRRAAATRTERAFIEAAPGSGKTTIAAERYGVIRYAGTTNRGRAVALSFTRSARHELARRIWSRWGTGAAAWPHEVVTLDALHSELLRHLLLTGSVQWPGGHTELQVLDTWRGQAGARLLRRENEYRRVATLYGARIGSRGSRITVPVHGIGARTQFEHHLADGRCTHDEIRQLLRVVLAREDLRQRIIDYLVDTVTAVVVDEVFDANELDLRIVALATEAGIPTTLIGDPWQALYGFRGARPDMVPALIANHGYQVFPVTQSFRFETPDMRQLAAALRAGEPVTLPHGDPMECNVVLASRWDALWETAQCVLPVSFGRIDNQTDAAIVILLDRLVQAHFQHNAIFAPEAAALLGLDISVLRTDGPAALGPVLETLSAATPTAAVAAIAQLRSALGQLGSPRALRRLSAPSEAEQIGRLLALARRMTQPRLVPGMTVHQAKGREWNAVGVRLNEAELRRLASGLSQGSDDDRILYVALTRARRDVWLV